MAFDLSTARPVEQPKAGGFDLSTARPVEQAEPVPAMPQQPEPSYFDQLRGALVEGRGAPIGAAEALGTFVSGSIAEPLAGLAGIVQSVNPLAEPGAGAQAVTDARNALTYQPRTAQGQQYLQQTGAMLQPVANVLQAAERRTGDAGYDLAGPVGGALGAAIPSAMMQVAGLSGGKAVSKGVQIARAGPGPDDAALIAAAKSADVPLMTSDVFPPKGYLGRFAQSFAEKLGPLGTGRARISQQAARERAVTAFAENMDIDLDSPFAERMVQSLDRQLSSEIKRAGDMRTAAVASLDQYGAVPLSRTKAAVAREIARQQRLGPRADQAHIANLQNTLDAMDGGDFSLVKDIRTEVISDLKALRKAEDARAEASLQSVKSAIDDDLKSFAVANDRNAASKWIKSNRIFADAYTRAKDTELKRVLMKGEATPEVLLPVLRGGKVSELERLAKSMGPEGREAARRAIIQDALKDSKYFEVDANPNPDAFTTAINRPNRQQAIRVFFTGDAKTELDGLTRVLDATRRAQQGAAVVKTGEQIIPIGAAVATVLGLQADALTTGGILATASALIKGYESRPFRQLLLKLGNTQPMSAKERRLIQLATSTGAGGLQAATREEEAAKP